MAIKFTRRQATILTNKIKAEFEAIAAIYNTEENVRYIVRDERENAVSMFTIAFVSNDGSRAISSVAISRLMQYAQQIDDEYITAFFAIETREQYDVKRNVWRTYPAFVMNVYYTTANSK